MTLPRTYRALGLTLRKRPIGEADVLSTLLTREHGKLEVVARGARRINGKLVGHFEPLTLLNVALARGRTLDTVAEAEDRSVFAAVKADYHLLSRALYVVELVDAFSALSEPDTELFDLTLQTLNVMESGAATDLHLRYFEIRLLRLSGFMPELFSCIDCGSPLEPERHRFAAGAGGTMCLDCVPTETLSRPLSLPALKVLRLLHRTPLVSALPDLRVPSLVQREVNEALSSCLQYWLDGRINSVAFIEKSGEKTGTISI